MILFFLTSLIGFLFYQAAASAGVMKYTTHQVIDFRLFTVKISQEHSDKLRVFSYFAAASMLTAIVFLVVYELADTAESSAIFRYRDNILIGAIFGPVAAIWFNTVVSTDSAAGLTKGQTVTAVLLGIVCLVGSFGFDARYVLRQYGKSINRVSLGGLEVSFTAKDASGTAQTAAVVMTPGFGSETVTARSSGLKDLSELADLIERDCKYLELNRIAASDPDKADLLAIPSCKTETLQRMMDFFRLVLGDHAQCAQGLYTNTADPSFADNGLRAIASQFRLLMSKNFVSDQEFIDSSTALLWDEADKIIKSWWYIAMESFMRGEPSLNDAARRDVIKSCLPLALRVKCGKIYTSEARKNIRDAFNNWAKQSFGKGAEAFCQDSNLSSTSTDGLADSSKRKFERHVGRNLRIMLDGGDRQRDAQGDVHRYPYVTIAHADLSAFSGNYEGGLQRLDEWIEINDPVASADDENPVSEGMLHDLRYFSLRSRMTMALFTEEWLRRLEGRAPIGLREYHLQNLRRITALADQMPFSKKILQSTTQYKIDLERDDFRDMPYGGPGCPFKDEDYVRYAALYLNTKLLYVYNALKHPDFERKYASKALNVVRSVVNADMSCLRDIVGNDAYVTLRGDALDLYAQVRLRVIQASHRHRSGIDGSTFAAVKAAVALGLALVADLPDPDAKRTTGFLSKISPSASRDTELSLRRTSALVDDLVKSAEAGN